MRYNAHKQMANLWHPDQYLRDARKGKHRGCGKEIIEDDGRHLKMLKEIAEGVC